MPPRTLLGNGLKVLLSSQAFFPLQSFISLLSQHGLYRKPLPPLGPSALQYQSPPPCAHPLQKSVCPLSADRTWLIGPLHCMCPSTSALKNF